MSIAAWMCNRPSQWWWPQDSRGALKKDFVSLCRCCQRPLRAPEGIGGTVAWALTPCGFEVLASAFTLFVLKSHMARSECLETFEDALKAEVMAGMFGLLSLTAHACMACPWYARAAINVLLLSLFGEVLCLVRPRADGGGSFGAGRDNAAASPCIETLAILHGSRGWGASTTCSQAGVRAVLFSKAASVIP